MTLDKLNIGDKAVVKAINCNNALKNRFYSFGIIKGAIINIEEVTLTKSTIKIRINQTKIALRLNEAASIEVEYAE